MPGAYAGCMTPTLRRAEVHRLVDRLAAGQVEALYVLLRGMLARYGGVSSGRERFAGAG